LEEADVQRIISPDVAGLTDENIGELIALSEAEDKQDSKADLERSLLTTSALKKVFKMADNSVDYLFDVDSFMNRYLNFKNVIEAVREPCSDMYKYTEKGKTIQGRLFIH
jgi:hypothetical protein